MPPSSAPPIAITSLSIRNFRGIRELDLDLRRPDGQPNSLVVLAGPNGCGKTAILEAALIALGGHKLAVGPVGRRAVRSGANAFELRAVLRETLSGETEKERIVSSEAPLPERERRFPFWYFSSWRAPALVGAVNVTVGRPGRRPAKNDPNRLWNVKQLLANAAAMQHFQLHGARRPLFGGDYASWIGQINEAWTRFYPDQDGGFFVGLADSEDEGTGAFEVYYGVADQPALPVDDLSAGQLELFLFLAALVLNDDREGVVLIDEPELHLDPQWHAQVLRTLIRLQPRAQFLVATHSPQIYESAMSYERHFLVPTDDPRAAIWGQAAARG